MNKELAKSQKNDCFFSEFFHLKRSNAAGSRTATNVNLFVKAESDSVVVPSLPGDFFFFFIMTVSPVVLATEVPPVVLATVVATVVLAAVVSAAVPLVVLITLFPTLAVTFATVVTSLVVTLATVVTSLVVVLAKVVPTLVLVAVVVVVVVVVIVLVVVATVVLAAAAKLGLAAAVRSPSADFVAMVKTRPRLTRPVVWRLPVSALSITVQFQVCKYLFLMTGHALAE